MTRAAFYIRVSSVRQVEEGHSLGEQEARCRSYIEARDWTLDERHTFTERGVSGGKSSRPALDAMREAAEGGEFDKLVGADLDRIGRSALDTLKLLDRLDALGIEPLDTNGRSYAASDAGAKMTRGVIALAAQYERDMLAERVRRATPGKRARGSYNGGPRPCGYEFVDGGGLTIVASEAEVVRRIFREYNAGRALRAIARDLNTEGFRGPLGGSWSEGRVADRLDLSLYAGIVGGGERGRHEPIIDAETWARTRALRGASAEREGKRKGGRRSSTHLLGNGLLTCGCGASFYPRKDTRSNRDTYRCRGRDERLTDCDMPPLPRSAVDAAVRNYIAGHVLSPGMAEGELEAEAKKAARDATKQAEVAEREASKIEKRLFNGRKSMLDDEPPFTPSEWRKLKADLEGELRVARERAAEAKRITAALRAPSADLLGAVEAIRQAAADEAADAKTLAAQRAAIERIFTRFEVIASSVEDAPAPPADPVVADLVAQQAHVAGQAVEDVPEFEFKPKRGRPAMRVAIVPIPRPEVADRFGAIPLDSLPELGPTATSQNIRNGSPWRYSRMPA